MCRVISERSWGSAAPQLTQDHEGQCQDPGGNPAEPPVPLHAGSLLAPETGVIGLPLTEKSHGNLHPLPWEHRDLGSRVTLEECRESFLFSISERRHGLAGVWPGHLGCVPAMELGPVTQRSPDSRGAAPGWGRGGGWRSQGQGRCLWCPYTDGVCPRPWVGWTPPLKAQGPGIDSPVPGKGYGAPHKQAPGAQMEGLGKAALCEMWKASRHEEAGHWRR